MKIHIQDHAGYYLAIDVQELIIPLWDSEKIAISVIDGREVVVIRQGRDYPNGGECVYSEIIND